MEKELITIERESLLLLMKEVALFANKYKWNQIHYGNLLNAWLKHEEDGNNIYPTN
jgi:hypothetical protein